MGGEVVMCVGGRLCFGGLSGKGFKVKVLRSRAGVPEAPKELDPSGGSRGVAP